MHSALQFFDIPLFVMVLWEKEPAIEHYSTLLFLVAGWYSIVWIYHSLLNNPIDIYIVSIINTIKLQNSGVC